ncbi:MAG: hypothetical protein HZA04_03925 [Nitrospinae bacterium]|nr:hypothetical protein [Nitrospinota bacterium]
MLVAFEILAVFILDYRHEAEQDVYNGPFSQTARSLWEAGSYILDGAPAFYPLWGYPLLVLLCGFSPIILLAVQGALCFSAVAYLYATLRIRPSYWHLPILVPFIALCSIKWPQAITATLLVILLCSYKRYMEKPSLKLLLIGGFAAGLAVNMRGESWIWGPVIFFSLIFSTGPGLRARGARFGAAVVVIQLLCISPWTIRAYAQLGTFRLTPSHGGDMALLSLGQFPDNPWGIECKDSFGHRFAAERNLGSPYSPSADVVMRREFFRRISEDPMAFAGKVFYNFSSVFRHGVFTGQFFTLAMTEAAYWENHEKLKAMGYSWFLTEMPRSIVMPMTLYLGVDYIFRAGWLLLLCAVMIVAVQRAMNGAPLPPMVSLTIAFIFATIALVSLLHYEPRHVTFLWLPLFASFLLMRPSPGVSARTE